MDTRRARTPAGRGGVCLSEMAARYRSHPRGLLMALACLAAYPVSSASTAVVVASQEPPEPVDAPSAQLSTDARLFDSHQLLAVTLAADFTALRGDRSDSPDRPGTLTVADHGGRAREIPVEVRTRGAFRLDPSNCAFPPLRVEIDGDAASGTVFEGQDDLKLVSSCQPERPSYEELVVKEYLAYRSLNLVTDASFRVRLLEATFEDTGGSGRATRVAFFIEEDEALARRLGATVFELEEGRNLPARAFEPVSRMTNAVAQYMLANPDWSDEAGHNVEILDRDGVALAIPYDFDFSGVVDAPYAIAPPEYQLESVRERYYRGWCENPLTTSQVLNRFREARDPVLDLWQREERLSPDARRRSVAFMEEFFDAIITGERAQRRFLRDCRALDRNPGGTRTLRPKRVS